MIPTTQVAVQLVGADRLALNTTKPVSRPAARQILGRVCCVGLCFSDMKLLHQFDQHVRKGPVVAGIAPGVLAQIPSYVPGPAPTVPGHEVVIEVVEVGAGVTSVAVGRRYLVQADWRDLKTAASNGAFGYDFEGGLQQYVLLDERVTVAADGTSYLVPVQAGRSASATALVEPWACVEDAFIHRERTALKKGGTLLLAGTAADLTGLDVATCGRKLALDAVPAPGGFTRVGLADLKPGSVDDLLIAGSDPALVEKLTPLLAKDGLCLLATGGARFGREVQIPVGRVHYGNIRFCGTTGTAFAKALARIPATGEVRPGDHISVIGAAGPMGSMAVIRCAALGLPGTTIDGSDMAEDRLAVLERKAAPVAAAKRVPLRLFNPKTAQPTKAADYVMVMVPVGPLVAGAVRACSPGAIVNIFAGIPADVQQAIDLDAYCDKGVYFVGTSGSTMDDIRAVLAKVEAGELDTDLSVGAVSGMGGAIEGLEAVKTGRISGKILVYPALGDLGLMDLKTLAERHPAVGAKLRDGSWTKAAEDELLKLAR